MASAAISTTEFILADGVHSNGDGGPGDKEDSEYTEHTRVKGFNVKHRTMYCMKKTMLISTHPGTSPCSRNKSLSPSGKDERRRVFDDKGGRGQTVNSPLLPFFIPYNHISFFSPVSLSSSFSPLRLPRHILFTHMM